MQKLFGCRLCQNTCVKTTFRKSTSLYQPPDLLNRPHALLNRSYALLNRSHALLNWPHTLQTFYASRFTTKLLSSPRYCSLNPLPACY